MPSPFPNAITPMDDFNATIGPGVQCLRVEAHQNQAMRIELTFFVQRTDGRQTSIVIDAHGRLQNPAVVAEAVAAALVWASAP